MATYDLSTITKTITNLATARTATFTNMSAPVGGVFTHPAGALAIAQHNMTTPTYGHKYYGRCYQKSPADHTWGDARFEYYAEDVAGTGLMTFGFMEPTNNEWKILSSIQELTGEPTGTTWVLRSFVSNGSSDSYRKEILIIDLTATYGEGSEPTKEWCDENIPFFEGTIKIIDNLVEGDVINCPYTGAKDGVMLTKGAYDFEVWGAAGGTYNSSYAAAGKGGYASGRYKTSKATGLILYAGGAGSAHTTTTYTSVGGGGFNGGGNAAYRGGGGGGASDIRIGYDSLYARALVAGGGGGTYAYSSTYKATGGNGGGILGVWGRYYQTTYGAFVGGPGEQTVGGRGGTGSSTNYNGKAGTFGQGGNTGYKYNSTSYYSAGAGGGGWYGGGGSGNYSGSNRYRGAGSSGGSGYVYTRENAINYPQGCLLDEIYLTDGNISSGSNSFPSITEGSVEVGHSGNGYVRITVIEQPKALGYLNNKEITKPVLGEEECSTVLLGSQKIWGEEIQISEYTELEYIESTGTQFIDTGVFGEAIGTYEIKFNMLNNGYQNYEMYFAGDLSAKAPKLYLNGDTDIIADIGTAVYTLFSKDAETHIVKVTDTEIICDEVSKASYTSNIWGEKSFYIFSAHEQPDLKSTMRLYYLKMYSDGVLIRDFIPVKWANGEVGLYDKVEHKFYPNNGTGNFNYQLMQKINYVMLYDNGDECTDVTGGWDQYENSSSTYWTYGALTKGTNALTTTFTGNKIYSLGTNNNIDMTPYSKMFIKYNFTSSYSYFVVSLNLKQLEGSTVISHQGGYNFSNKQSAFGVSINTTNGTYKFVKDLKDLGYTVDSVSARLYTNGESTTSGSMTTNFYELAYFKPDNWQKLCKIAQLDATLYRTEKELSQNQEALTAILNNQEAVEWMIHNCTGSFMIEFVMSSVGLSVLEESSYKDIIKSNSHWARFLNTVAS